MIQQIANSMKMGRVIEVKNNISKALEEGLNAKDILDNGLIATMEDIGDKFAKNQVFIPEVMMAARAMNEGIAILKPHLITKSEDNKGKVLICTVQGDSHDIGKNLVKIMLEGVGLDVVDLGANVPTVKIINRIKEGDINVLCMSALLTTTMPMLKTVIDTLVAQNLRDSVKIMVGGAPVTSDYATKIGADGYSDNASDAAKLAKSFLNA